MSRHGDGFDDLREEPAAKAMLLFLGAPLDFKRDNRALIRTCRILA
jgi:hypothetical protein